MSYSKGFVNFMIAVKCLTSQGRKIQAAEQRLCNRENNKRVHDQNNKPLFWSKGNYSVPSN